MTSLTTSQGKVLSYTSEFIETTLLPLSPRNIYYATGAHDIKLKNDYDKLLTLDCAYSIYY